MNEIPAKSDFMATEGRSAVGGGPFLDTDFNAVKVVEPPMKPEDPCRIKSN